MNRQILPYIQIKQDFRVEQKETDTFFSSTNTKIKTRKEQGPLVEVL